MSEKIGIYTKSTGYVSAEISFENNARTANAILAALPIRGRVNQWGDEIYFNIPVIEKEENAIEEVTVGDLGYWPPGHGFCIFFGRTPVSTSDKPRAASPVNIFGRVLDDVTVFRKTKSGEEIIVAKIASSARPPDRAALPYGMRLKSIIGNSQGAAQAHRR